MSLYTLEEWDKIIHEQLAVIQRVDEYAANADRLYKEWTTPHYLEYDCHKCGGTGKVKGILFAHHCFTCGGKGKVRSSTPVYYSPGDPHGYYEAISHNSPLAERWHLRQLQLKRFMDLNPEHKLTQAIKERLTTRDEFPPPKCIPNIWDMSAKETTPCFDPAEPVKLLNGEAFPDELWRYIPSRE